MDLTRRQFSLGAIAAGVLTALRMPLAGPEETIQWCSRIEGGPWHTFSVVIGKRRIFGQREILSCWVDGKRCVLDETQFRLLPGGGYSIHQGMFSRGDDPFFGIGNLRKGLTLANVCEFKGAVDPELLFDTRDYLGRQGPVVWPRILRTGLVICMVLAGFMECASHS